MRGGNSDTQRKEQRGGGGKQIKPDSLLESNSKRSDHQVTLIRTPPKIYGREATPKCKDVPGAC